MSLPKQNFEQLPYHLRSLSRRINYIKKVCELNNIDENIKDISCELYKLQCDYHSFTKIIFRGRINNAICAACVYEAHIISNVKVDIYDISKIFDLDINTTTKGILVMEKLKKLNVFNLHQNIETFDLDVNTTIKEILVTEKLKKLNVFSLHQNIEILSGMQIPGELNASIKN